MQNLSISRGFDMLPVRDDLDYPRASDDRLGEAEMILSVNFTHRPCWMMMPRTNVGLIWES
jgi:hypothetical protein